MWLNSSQNSFSENKSWNELTSCKTRYCHHHQQRALKPCGFSFVSLRVTIKKRKPADSLRRFYISGAELDQIHRAERDLSPFHFHFPRNDRPQPWVHVSKEIKMLFFKKKVPNCDRDTRILTVCFPRKEQGAWLLRRSWSAGCCSPLSVTSFIYL